MSRGRFGGRSGLAVLAAAVAAACSSGSDTGAVDAGAEAAGGASGSAGAAGGSGGGAGAAGSSGSAGSAGTGGAAGTAGSAGADAGCGDCDDGNPCTADACAGGTCTHTSDDAAACAGGACHGGACCTGCWDGTACQAGDAALTCGVGGVACTRCDDANPCTTDACVAGACDHAIDDTATCSNYVSSVYRQGRCSGGQCCSGCLAGGVCEDGSNSSAACGQGGLACRACDTGQTCTLGSCALEFRLAGATSVSLGPDADGDGLADLVVGAAQWANGGQTTTGQAHLYSGATLALLHTWQGATQDDRLGTIAQLGPDADGDGRGDVLVTAPGSDAGTVNAGRVTLYSGATFAVLCEWTGTSISQALGGSAVVLGPDATGDGRADVLMGRGLAGGMLTLYSGADCSAVRTHTEGSVSVSLGPDVDADGLADLLHADTSRGSVWLRSGATLAELYFENRTATFGAALSLGPDVSGDGRPDFVVGYPGWGSNQQGVTELHDGVTGTRLESWQGNDNSRFGSTSILGPDADGDGRGDVLTTSSGRVDLWSGALPGHVRHWRTPSLAATVGPDRDGDGLGDAALILDAGTSERIVVYGSRTW